MTVSTAELGLSPKDLGIVIDENPEEAELPLVPEFTEAAEAEIALTPYQILEEGFIENNNGDNLVRIKKTRKTGRRVQVLTDEAKDLSKAFVEALCGPQLENLDQEQLTAEVDSYYHQLVDSGYKKIAAYRIKQSAIFRIQHRIKRQNILASEQTIAETFSEPEVAVLPPTDGVTDELIDLDGETDTDGHSEGEMLDDTEEPVIEVPEAGINRFRRLKEAGRWAITAVSLGVALLGLAKLTQAKEDLPVADFARPTPITVDYRAHLSEQDQIRAEQHYFSSLPLATATANPADYSAAQTGTNNPEAPELEIMQGNMTLSFAYPDGSQYTYGQQVGIEDTQTFDDVEENEELAPTKLNGLRIVETEGTAIVHAHQTWKQQEGPFTNFSSKAKAVGDDNLNQLYGTHIDLTDQNGQKLDGRVTGIELLSADDAKSIYYQTRAIRGLDGFHVLTCHRQNVHGNTNQWLWITVETDTLPTAPTRGQLSYN
jgi:hypothetical protein